ncbi:MAG: M48 family metalloprotease [Planctomycetota bacterium]
MSTRRTWLWLSAMVALPLGLVACAQALGVLEDATDPNSVGGKLVRGANRLRKSAQDLDPSEEHYIGRTVAAQILSMPRYSLSTDTAMTGYVTRVGLGVALSNDAVRHTFAGYHFAVLDTDEVNALACPGGTIFVTRGLLKDASTEGELAAILAHEIAHVTLRHGLSAIKAANLTQAFQYLGSGALQAAGTDNQDLQKLATVFDDSVKDVVGALVTNGYSRDAEREADRLGRTLLAGAGYDPQGLSRVLAKMSHAGGQGGMFATHPAPSERQATLGEALPFTADAEGEAVRAQRFAAAMTR